MSAERVTRQKRAVAHLLARLIADARADGTLVVDAAGGLVPNPNTETRGKA